MDTKQYLIADSKAHIAALLRAQDGKTRDRIRQAIQRNSQFKVRAGDRRGSKAS